MEKSYSPIHRTFFRYVKNILPFPANLKVLKSNILPQMKCILTKKCFYKKLPVHFLLVEKQGQTVQ